MYLFIYVFMYLYMYLCIQYVYIYIYASLQVEVIPSHDFANKGNWPVADLADPPCKLKHPPDRKVESLKIKNI